LLIATDEFGLNTLGEYIQEFLINNKEEFLQKDPIGILENVFQHETFATLKDYCLETICQKPDILFETEKISELPEQVLESLLLRDDLNLDEIKVWNNLIKWGHAQHPTIDNDTSKWTKEDCVLMEKTISRFIPLIRFHDISSIEFYDKVLPYEDLLPKKLKHEILHSYLVSNVEPIGSLPSRNNTKLDSTIISEKHLALFASWIDKKDKPYNLGNLPYKFNLIFRTSRDGFDNGSFYAKCGDKKATIFVVKIKNSIQIIGGYNPLNWIGNRIIKNTQDSFIFSFKDFNDINTGKIGRIIKSQHAVYCYNKWGPTLGWNGISCDLNICNNFKGGSSVITSYPNINIPESFVIDDCEVFHIIRKR